MRVTTRSGNLGGGWYYHVGLLLSDNAIVVSLFRWQIRFDWTTNKGRKP